CSSDLDTSTLRCTALLSKRSRSGNSTRISVEIISRYLRKSMKESSKNSRNECQSSQLFGKLILLNECTKQMENFQRLVNDGTSSLPERDFRQIMTELLKKSSDIMKEIQILISK